ncbi:type I-C CRISPR-associated protein Cas7/Csd2 [Ignavigranum ruoffiae]|uniref:type I-C CRISPR-associated protein Cas7/Csd2 n=1 Tax=Ignavigranum ruoffiae TaxID=89093 RepID=UPI00206EE5A2|nr:type I-C CRISPR-associated protein Cas7/Csd2 [Ignavigranum ruoffiae]UPQ85923.1 type I-C CRISPR-associated protein Cas7/Csd2 [Ignavigranum ruoffiae]
MINNKIDFILTIEVQNANPNGDPLAGNMPRTDSKGFGEISDVAIKRKIRNRMQDLGNDIFVVAKDRAVDGFKSLEERFKSVFEKKSKFSDDVVEKTSCEKWLDVRSFGQVITYQNRSIGIRGPISIGITKSLQPVEVVTMQITKSVNGKETENKNDKSSDTMGSKHFVEHGVYVIYGSVNAYFADKTGFSENDLQTIKECLTTLFVNDASSARPEGSMEVKELFWFEHSNKLGNISSSKIRELLLWDVPNEELDKRIQYSDYNIRIDAEKLKELEENGLKLEIIPGY